MENAQNERIKIGYPVFVEGKYDRLRLLSVIDADIYTTEGFGIFKSAEKKLLLTALSKKTRIIVLTDSDGAGKVIRSHISSLIPKDRIIPLYIPQIAGKERRKAEPSKEGFLGVEGMERELLRSLLLPYAENGDLESIEGRRRITKADLYEDGLTGAPDSTARRDALARRLGLPFGMTPNAFLAAINVLLTFDAYTAMTRGDGVTDHAINNMEEKQERPDGV